MMPACTGEPPGLLMRRITPAVPSSSNALCSAESMLSALALLFAAISPSMSTSAVWRAVFETLSPVKSNTPQAISAATPSNTNRKKIFQRRAARCSLIAASAMRSSAARSQFSPAGGGTRFEAAGSVGN